jgi:hypothetical protein
MKYGEIIMQLHSILSLNPWNLEPNQLFITNMPQTQNQLERVKLGFDIPAF